MQCHQEEHKQTRRTIGMQTKKGFNIECRELHAKKSSRQIRLRDGNGNRSKRSSVGTVRSGLADSEDIGTGNIDEQAVVRRRVVSRVVVDGSDLGIALVEVEFALGSSHEYPAGPKLVGALPVDDNVVQGLRWDLLVLVIFGQRVRNKSRLSGEYSQPS